MQRSSSEAKSASERDQCSAEVWFPIWAARVYSSYMYMYVLGCIRLYAACGSVAVQSGPLTLVRAGKALRISVCGVGPD